MEDAPSRSTRVLRWVRLKGEEITLAVIPFLQMAMLVGLVLDAYGAVIFDPDLKTWTALLGGSAAAQVMRSKEH